MASNNLTFITAATTDSSGGLAQRFIYTPKGQVNVLSSAWTTASDAYNWSYYFQGMRLVPDGNGNLLPQHDDANLRFDNGARGRARMSGWVCEWSKYVSDGIGQSAQSSTPTELR